MYGILSSGKNGVVTTYISYELAVGSGNMPTQFIIVTVDFQGLDDGTLFFKA